MEVLNSDLWREILLFLPVEYFGGAPAPYLWEGFGMLSVNHGFRQLTMRTMDLVPRADLAIYFIIRRNMRSERGVSLLVRAPEWLTAELATRVWQEYLTGRRPELERLALISPMWSEVLNRVDWTRE